MFHRGFANATQLQRRNSDQQKMGRNTENEPNNTHTPFQARSKKLKLYPVDDIMIVLCKRINPQNVVEINRSIDRSRVAQKRRSALDSLLVCHESSFKLVPNLFPVKAVRRVECVHALHNSSLQQASSAICRLTLLLEFVESHLISCGRSKFVYKVTSLYEEVSTDS